MIWTWRNQKDIPTPKTEVGKSKINNQVLRKHIASRMQSPIRKRKISIRVNLFRSAHFTRGKQTAHANTNTHGSKFKHGLNTPGCDEM